MAAPKIWGTDWTWRQGLVPASQIEKEGFSYVWLKSSGSVDGGGYFSDPMFQLSAKELEKTNLIKGAYHWLMPGNAGGQAAHFIDQVCRANGSNDTFGWLMKLDIEQPGITWDDILRFTDVFSVIEDKPLFIYTRKNTWQERKYGKLPSVPINYLEEAHWINNKYRVDDQLPYASQQYKQVDPLWWNTAYGNWPKADMLQFSDYAKIAGYRQMATVFPGTRDDLIEIANN